MRSHRLANWGVVAALVPLLTFQCAPGGGPPAKTAAQVVAEKIDSQIASYRNRNQAVPKIDFHFGASVSPADQQMTRDLSNAVFKYGFFPELAKYPFKIAVATSQQELVALSGSCCIDISQWQGAIAGAYGASGTAGVVLQNLTVHRCGTGWTAEQCSRDRGNGGEMGNNRVRQNIPHEISHGGKIALMGFDPTRPERYLEKLPYWYASGISNVFGSIIDALVQNKPYSNANISPSEGRRCQVSPIELTSITDGTRPGTNGSCKGMGTGDFASELLVARFGFDYVMEFIRASKNVPESRQWADWSSAWGGIFQELFLQSPAEFSKDVEIYRTAVINNTSLPGGFLDPVARPARFANGSTFACRTIEQFNSVLPVDVVDREWRKAVAAIQPAVTKADTSGKTTASIVTTNDMSNNLTYGRYYAQQYPSAIPDVLGGRCSALAMVLEVEVRFTGSDTSDAAARNGIHRAVKAALSEVVTKHRTVQNLGVDVLLVEAVLQHCPGREFRNGNEVKCPWNDWGFLYYRLADLTPSRVNLTPADRIFELGIPGAVFPPRPFVQIAGTTMPPIVALGSVRDVVPAVNSNHPAHSYVEFSSNSFEVGQSIVVTAPTRVSAINFRTINHVTMVNGRPTVRARPFINGNVRLRVWRYNGAGDIPTAIDLTSFSLVTEVTRQTPIPDGGMLSIPLAPGSALAPGHYLVTLALLSHDGGDGSYIRLAAFASGATGATDVYGPGRTYKACSMRSGSGYRKSDSPPVAVATSQPTGVNCTVFYPELSKGENAARPKQHTFVWSDLAMSLAP